MLQLRDDGLVRTVGVSNFSLSQLDALSEDGECGDASDKSTRPQCNQVELHPFLPQHALVRGLQDRGVAPVAFSPLGCPRKGACDVPHDRTLRAVADAVSARMRAASATSPPDTADGGALVTAATVALAWNLRRGVAVIPHSADAAEIRSNWSATEVVPHLTEADVAAISALAAHPSRRVRTLRFDWLPFAEEDALLDALPTTA